ncbi:hypothetical protein Droror1_Dr00023589 [Drosera rotundifolia]
MFSGYEKATQVYKEIEFGRSADEMVRYVEEEGVEVFQLTQKLVCFRFGESLCLGVGGFAGQQPGPVCLLET